MASKYSKKGGSSYFSRGGAGSDDEDDASIAASDAASEQENDNDNDSVAASESSAEVIVGSDDEGEEEPNLGEEKGEDQTQKVNSNYSSEDEGSKFDEEEDEIEDDEDMEDFDDGEGDEMGLSAATKAAKKRTPTPTLNAPSMMNEFAEQPGLDDEDEEDDEDGNYLQKFNADINKNYILDHHPECVIQNYNEIIAMAVVVRDQFNNIIDGLHRTLPYLTKYEKTRILGQRAKQINSGAIAFVKVPEKIVDGYLIAEMELVQKKIPFIIRRPLPNGASEYWHIKDLENIMF